MIAINAVLNAALANNGTLSVGLAGMAEQGTPMDYRIRVPQNLHAARRTDGSDALRIARWAYDRYLVAFPEDHVGAVGQWVTWALGGVALTRITNAGLPDNADGLRQLIWDTEVNILEEDCPGLGTAMDAAEVDNYLPRVDAAAGVDDRALIATVVSLIVAAKLTWWQTQHHLGPNVNAGAGRATHQGYLAKVANSVNLPTHGFASRTSISNLYNLVHPFSTISMFTLFNTVRDGDSDEVIAVKDRNADDLRLIFRVPGRLRTNGQWLDSDFWTFSVAADVQLRLNGIGAGFAPLADLYAGLKLLVGSPLLSAMPGLEQITTLCNQYTLVKTRPYRFGTNASYLCETGTTTVTNFETGPYAALHAAISTYIHVFHTRTTLAAANIYKAQPSILEGFDSSWHALCTNYNMARASNISLSSPAIAAIMTSIGAVRSQVIPATVLDALRNSGMTVNEGAINNYARIIHDAAAANPQLPPAPAQPLVQAQQQPPAQVQLPPVGPNLIPNAGQAQVPNPNAAPGNGQPPQPGV